MRTLVNKSVKKEIEMFIDGCHGYEADERIERARELLSKLNNDRRMSFNTRSDLYSKLKRIIKKAS